MIHEIFAIYDAVVGVYLRPFIAQNKGHVFRDLSEVVNLPKPPKGQEDKRPPLAKHASDFALFALGSFDDSTGKIDLLVAPERVIMLHELKKPKKKGDPSDDEEE